MTKHRKRFSANELKILEEAEQVLDAKLAKGETFLNCDSTSKFLKLKLAKNEEEVFAVMFLDSQHRLIEYKELFRGSVNCASVYPRVVVKEALALNAGAVILAHNHPSGTPEPSQADIAITKKLKDILAIVDVSVLDHIIVGESTTSLAQRSLM